jgi:chemotaxis protein CheC
VSKPEDRHAEFASLGAGHAATALAGLFDSTVLMEPSQCFRIQVGHLPESMVYQQEWNAAIFTDLWGAVTGQAGLMLSEAMVHQIIRRLTGEDPRAGITERGRSALEEMGNIALSAAAGAFGDMEGGIVIPSIPRLGFNLCEALLIEELGPGSEQQPAFLAESQLAELDGSLRIRFIWIPGEEPGIG